MNELEIIQHQHMEGLSLFFNTVDYRTSHLHSEWELILVLENPLRVTCGQSRFDVMPGQFVLFNPNQPHEFHKGEKSCTFLCLQISRQIVPLMEQVTVDGLQPQKHLAQEEHRQIARTLLDMARSYLYREPYYALYCLGQSTLILHTLLSKLPSHILSAEETASIHKRSARLQRLIRFVDENHMQKIRLSDFARQENCSMSYLSHFVKDALNQTFQEYVTSVRFNHACELIAGGDKRMLDVCMESGFSDYRYFSRAFRERFGMTPEEYSHHISAAQQKNSMPRHSAHSAERFYTREESVALLSKFSRII